MNINSKIDTAEKALANKNPKKTEELAWQVLLLDPKSEIGRIIWKQARKEQKKSFFSDLDEQIKMEIWLNYCRKRTFSLLEKSNSLGKVSYYPFWVNFDKAYWSEITSHMLQKKYGVEAFELSLIIQEGKTKEWDTGLDIFGKPSINRIEFRDDVYCQYCNIRQSAPYWPINGNMTSYFYKKSEESDDEEWVYKLPIYCPHCNKTWYVVWEEDPGDPLGKHIIQHLESASGQFPENRHILMELITDEILGVVVARLNKLIANLPDQCDLDIYTEHFLARNNFNIVTLCTETNWERARNLFTDGYPRHISNYVRQFAPENILSEIRLVHWVYAFSASHDISYAHLELHPSSKELDSSSIILPRQLFTDDEWMRLVEH